MLDEIKWKISLFWEVTRYRIKTARLRLNIARVRFKTAVLRIITNIIKEDV